MTARTISLRLGAFALLVAACGVPTTASEVSPSPEHDNPLLAEQSSVRVEVLNQQSTPLPEPATPAPSTEAVASPAPLGPTAVPLLATATPFVLVATATPVPPAVAPPPPRPEDLLAEATQLINAARAKSGLAPLSPNSLLASAATGHARQMAGSNFFGHYGPNGSTPHSRVIASGYSGAWRGEALAAGQTSGQALVDVWLNSAIHRPIVLDPAANEIGLGYHHQAGSYYTHYWVMDTGTR